MSLENNVLIQNYNQSTRKTREKFKTAVDHKIGDGHYTYQHVLHWGKNLKNYNDSLALCVASGGQLAVITNHKEKNNVISIIKKITKSKFVLIKRLEFLRTFVDLF